MPSYAQITDGVATNVIVADSAFAESVGAVLVPDGYGIGDLYDGTSWTKTGTEEDLENLRAHALREIDDAAETARFSHMTDGSGQAMTYQRKAEEAKAFAIDDAPVPENYPFLANEIGITAPTLAEVAHIVATNHEQWLAAGLVIERLRLQAKAAIRLAVSAEEIRLASDVSWP